jgi:tetratricopeptide (TPR) repeat protein
LVEEQAENHRAWAMRLQPALALGRKETVKKTADHFFGLFNERAEDFHSGKIEDPLWPAYVGLGIQEENAKDAFEVGFLLAEGLFEKRKIPAIDVSLWAARLALDKYSFSNAMERFEKVLKWRPRLPEALAGQAEIWLATRHDINRAQALLKEALEVHPGHLPSRLVFAATEFAGRHPEAAKVHIDRALAANPNHPEALAFLAYYHFVRSEEAARAEVEKRALALNPQNAAFFCVMGDLAESQLRFPDAAPFFEKAIRTDPSYWRGHYGLGMYTSRLGAHGEKEGKRLLLKAFSMNRFNVWASNMIRVLDRIIGDEEQGVPPQYASFQTKNFTLKFLDKESAILGPYFQEWAEAAYARQTELFRFRPEGPLTIECCYSFQDQAARTVGLPNLGALGVCFGQLFTAVSPREGKGAHPPFNWRKVIEHEFGHVMTLQRTKFRIPHWYTEAISVYLENDPRVEADGMMVEAIARGRIKKIENMEEYFRENPLMAYVHGRYFADYLEKNFGFEAHLKALKAFAEGGQAAEVFPAVTGASLETLNRGQLDYLHDFFRRHVRLRLPPDPAEFTRLETAAAAPEAKAADLAHLAQAQWTLRQFDAARLSAQKAIEQDPACALAFQVMGDLELHEKRLTEAKIHFEEAVKQDPEESFRAWHQLGILYKKEGRAAQAIAALQRALRLYPRYQGPDHPLHLLAAIYEEAEPPDLAKALETWRLALAGNPTDLQAARKGFQGALKEKAWPLAAEFAMAFIEVDPYDPKIHREAGRVFEELKNLPAAAREFGVACALDEADAEAWTGLARVEWARGRKGEAAKAIAAALSIDGTHAEAKALNEKIRAAAPK